jgi:rod shape determining protein RodA
VLQVGINVGAEGWSGRGLGNGTQTQLTFLRVQHADYVVAVLAEELGFVGAVGCRPYSARDSGAACAWRRVRAIASGAVLAAGLTAMLLFQVGLLTDGALSAAGMVLPRRALDHVCGVVRCAQNLTRLWPFQAA